MGEAPLRIGLVGCGNISSTHQESIRSHPETVALVAVCDVDEARARAVAAGTPGCQAFGEWQAMLDTRVVEAVLVCLPHAEHLPVGLAAAHAGVHILVEKPMACTPEQGRQLVDAAERAGVTLMVAQHQRFEPTYRAVRRMIASGTLGDVFAASFECMQNMRAYAPPGHWLYDGAIAGGGIIISVAIHRIDLLRFLLADEVTRVQAITGTHDPAFTNGAEDLATGTLEFSKGTTVGFFTTYSAVHAPFGESFMLFGERGTVHAVPPTGSYVGPAVVAADGLPATPPIHGFSDQYTGFALVEPEPELPTSSPYANELLHFVACCRTGARPLSDGRDNLKTLAVVDAIYRSGRTRSPVILDA